MLHKTKPYHIYANVTPTLIGIMHRRLLKEPHKTNTFFVNHQTKIPTHENKT